MKKILLLLFFLQSFYISNAQKKTIYGDLRSTDSTKLNIIKVAPDSFPSISVIFEALKNNQPIFGLKSEHLTISENNEDCRIIKLSEISQNHPINISLIIDHSGSMSEDRNQLIDSVTNKPLYTYELKNGVLYETFPPGYIAPIDNAKKAVSQFISEMPSSKDSIHLLGFSSIVDISSHFTTDKKYLQSIIDTIQSFGRTAFLDAINVSLDSLKNHSGIKVIIALTDGLDNSSHITKEEIIKKSKKLKIPVYTIGLGDVDKKFLSDISKETAGAFYYTKGSNSLADIYSEIQKRIHSIYDVQYVSENLNPEDSVRSIEIKFKVDSLYLGDNITEMNLPKEAIDYIINKKQKKKYMIAGFSVTAIVGFGLVLFYYRKKKIK